MSEWTEAVCGDGAVVLRDGVPVSISDVLCILNEYVSEVRDQTPPADELAAVRAEIKALEVREGELRALMMSDPSARTGNRFAATIQTSNPERTDLKELRADYPDIVAEYTFKRPVTTVVLKAIDQETGELLHIRKRDNAV